MCVIENFIWKNFGVRMKRKMTGQWAVAEVSYACGCELGGAKNRVRGGIDLRGCGPSIKGRVWV
jgi:hypothetical protein